MYKVFSTKTYDDEVEKLPLDYQQSIQRVEQQLAKNPFVGKNLSYRFLREKRIREKRIYYLVYEDIVLILLVAVSGKKDQQKTIDHIKNNFGEFKKYAEKLSTQSV